MRFAESENNRLLMHFEAVRTWVGKWKETVWMLLLAAISIVSAALGVTACAERLSAAWAFNTGMDAVGILTCTLLYFGCFTERQNADKTTRLFMTMLFNSACMQFLDMASWLLEGIPALRTLNTAVYALYLCAVTLLAFQFWRYIRAYLNLEGTLLRRCNLVMYAMLPLELAVCLSNLFVPLCFYVDEGGNYFSTDGYLLSIAFIPVLAVCATVSLLRANAPLRSKAVIAVFYVMPLLYAAFYADSNGAALPDAPYTAIILMYVILVSGRAKSLAATQSELDMATRIQENMLPNIFPAFPKRSEFDLYATMDPAKEVGGDFYDFFLIDSDHLAMVVADVSGKGVPAALFMMTARTILKTRAQSSVSLSPKELLVDANAALTENNKEGMFVTVWFGILEISTGTLTYADAGHEKLLLYQDGAWRFLPKKTCGPALAMWEPDDFELVDDKFQYCNETIRLRPGDAIFQYTDGVTEATNAGNELFGDDRLLRAMNGAPSAEPEELLPHVRARIDEFVKNAPQFDDITMLGLRYKGAKQGEIKR